MGKRDALERNQSLTRMIWFWLLSSWLEQSADSRYIHCFCGVMSTAALAFTLFKSLRKMRKGMLVKILSLSRLSRSPCSVYNIMMMKCAQICSGRMRIGLMKEAPLRMGTGRLCVCVLFA